MTIWAFLPLATWLLGLWVNCCLLPRMLDGGDE